MLLFVAVRRKVVLRANPSAKWRKVEKKHVNMKEAKSGVTNLSLTMYPFSISTEEDEPLKFLITKYFSTTDRTYIEQ